MVRGTVNTEKEPPVSVVSPLVREKKKKPDSDLPIDMEFTEKTSTSTAREKVSRGTRDERAAAEIADALHEKTVTLFGMLSGFMPVTSVYAVENSEKAVRALINIGKRNPKILAYLSKAASGIDALEIGKFVLGLLVCVQVDTGRAKGDELPARAFGVTEILQEHFWEGTTYDVNDSVLMQEVPGFAAV